MSAIIVAANGPSALSERVKAWPTDLSRVFRTNYFFLPEDDPLDYRVHDWFICEDIADTRIVRAAMRFGNIHPTIWIPGITESRVNEIETNYLAGFPLRVQKTFAGLPARCRWERDLVPERPLMGSFAIAVAVGMQPDELFLCGHDLFSHPSKQNHGGLEKNVRPWQDEFVREYITNTHRNHRLSGDLKYIQNALDCYGGHVVSVGTVLKNHFADRYPGWEWIDG